MASARNSDAWALWAPEPPYPRSAILIDWVWRRTRARLEGSVGPSRVGAQIVCWILGFHTAQEWKELKTIDHGQSLPGAENNQHLKDDGQFPTLCGDLKQEEEVTRPNVGKISAD